MVEVSQRRSHLVDEGVGDDWPSEAEIEAEVARYLEVYERVKARRASDPDQDYVRYHMSALQLATRGMTPEERAEMFEFVIHYDLEPDDPVFLAYAAHGQVFTLLKRLPKKLVTLLEGWLRHVQRSMQDYQSAAVAVHQAEVSRSVNILLQKTAADQFIRTLNVTSILVSSVLLLTAMGIGWLLGDRYGHWSRRYAPGQPQTLTIQEVTALDWAMGPEGQLARRLVEMNRDLLMRRESGVLCEQEAQRAGLTRIDEHGTAADGFCLLWVKPMGERVYQ